MNNEDYVDPEPFTRGPEFQHVYPATTREDKAAAHAQHAENRERDRQFLDGLDHEALMDLCEQHELPVGGSTAALRARLMGEAEPSGPRFAT